MPAISKSYLKTIAKYQEALIKCLLATLTAEEAILYFLQDPDRGERRLSYNDALKEVADLNTCQLLALEQLYDAGLSGDLLRAWEPHNMGADQFAVSHLFALILLTAQHGLVITEAVAEIDQLSASSAVALYRLYEYGMRNGLLQKIARANFVLEEYHIDAIKFLIAAERGIRQLSLQGASITLLVKDLKTKQQVEDFIAHYDQEPSPEDKFLKLYSRIVRQRDRPAPKDPPVPDTAASPAVRF